jgi:hypothetical protein
MTRRDLEKLVLAAAAGIVVGSVATKAEAATKDNQTKMKESCKGSGSCKGSCEGSASCKGSCEGSGSCKASGSCSDKGGCG